MEGAISFFTHDMATETPIENGLEKHDFQALGMSFMVILVSEIGDKTFLIAAVLAMTHSRYYC